MIGKHIDDRLAISKIYEESWKCAYKGIIPQDYLDSIPEGRWSSNLDNSNWKTLICIDDGRIVGTSSFCKSRFEQFHGWGEVISIYLQPDYMGKGYGKVLMKSVLSELRMQGYENIFLWVLEENIRARHFYEQFGFSPTDDFINDNIGGKELREVFLMTAFSAEEREKILLSNVVNPTQNTQDYIFVLCYDEVEKYFDDEKEDYVDYEERGAVTATYARKQGAWFLDEECDEKNKGCWWLRYYGEDYMEEGKYDFISCVNFDGYIEHGAEDVSGTCCIR